MESLEKWKSLIYNGKKIEYFMISNKGRIKSLTRTYIDSHGTGRKRTIPGRIRKIRTNGKEPYLFLDLQYTEFGIKKHRSIYVHKAVYESFIRPLPKRKNRIYVSHKDENTFNNILSNLYLRSHSVLQKNNMVKYPQNRWRLSRFNEKNGYEFVKKSHKRLRKVSPSIHKEILYKYMKQNKTYSEIAAELNLSKSTIYKYVNLVKLKEN